MARKWNRKARRWYNTKTGKFQKGKPPKTEFYKSIVVYNPSGSIIDEAEEDWGFTIEATVFTLSAIDIERLKALDDLAKTTMDRIVYNARLHHNKYDTAGSGANLPATARDVRSMGFYRAEVSKDDVVLGKCDFRYRRHLKAKVRDLVEKMDRDGLLTY